MKVFFLIMLSQAHALIANSQDCPSRYSSRNVLCGEQLVTKCVPDDYTCKSCWKIVWPKCNSDERGGSQFVNSYNDALSIAEKRKAMLGDKNCQGSNTTDYSQYQIYLVGGSNCNAIISDKTAFGDFKSRAKYAVDKYSAEEIAFDQFLKKMQQLGYYPEYIPGSVIKEYQNMLKESDENVQSLSTLLSYMANENLAEIEKLTTDIEESRENLFYLRENIKTLAEQARKQKEQEKKEKKTTEKKENSPAKGPFEQYADDLTKEKTKARQLKKENSSVKGVFEQYADSLDEEKIKQEQYKKENPIKSSQSNPNITPNKPGKSTKSGNNSSNIRQQKEGKWTFVFISTADNKQIVNYISKVVSFNEVNGTPMKWFYNKLINVKPELKGDYNFIVTMNSPILNKHCQCSGDYTVIEVVDDGQCAFYKTKEDAEKERVKILKESKIHQEGWTNIPIEEIN